MEGMRVEPRGTMLSVVTTRGVGINGGAAAHSLLIKTGFLHILISGFPGLFHDFKPNFHDQTEISV